MAAAAQGLLAGADQLKDVDYLPPLGIAVPLGIQHVLAMFVSNVTPASSSPAPPG
jgi:NCS2 family nucleobase:cation symporter-2